jgi:hypothetical protein
VQSHEMDFNRQFAASASIGGNHPWNPSPDLQT